MNDRRRIEIINLLLGLQQAEEEREHPDQHRIGLFIDARVAVGHAPRTRAAMAQRTAAQRVADRIDGYDRDDLGESPDY